MLVWAHVAYAQDIDSWAEVGRLPVRYIDTAALDAAPMNWDIAQDSRGILYIANLEGLLIHDGVSWEMVRIPGGNVVRALEVGPDDTVYIGSFGQIGSLSADSLGAPAFLSFMDHIPSEYHDFTDVARIIAVDQSVFFLTENYLFQWKENAMRVWNAEDHFADMTVMDGRLIVAEPNTLSYLTEDGELERIQRQGPILSTYNEMIADGPGHVLILTRREGLLRCAIDVEAVSECNIQHTNIDTWLYDNMPYKILRLPDGTLAIGFDGKGLALLDESRSLLRLVNEYDGLMNLEVMNVFLSKEGALWLALYDGLARVEARVSWSTFSRAEGLHSQVNEIMRWKDRLLVTTMLGMFELKPGTMYTPARFEKFTTEQYPYCDDMMVVQSELLAGCFGALVQIDALPDQPLSITPLLDDDSYHIIVLDPYDPTIFYTSGFEGISKMRWKDGAPERIARETIAPLVFDILIDPVQPNPESTRLWAATHPYVLYRIDIPHDGSDWETLLIDESHNLTAPLNRVFLQGDTLRVATDEGLFSLHSSSTDTPQFTLDERIGNRPVGHVGELIDGTAWIAVDDTIRVMQKHLDNDQAPATYEIPPRIKVLNDPGLYEEADGALWIGHARGIARVSSQKKTGQRLPPSVLISKITTTSIDSLLYNGIVGSHPSLTIPHGQNSLQFDYAAQVYDAPEHVRYRVWLEGFDPGWLKWSAETRKEYTRLPEGSYTLHVQARTLAGTTSEVASASFTVLPPWYRTGWAYMLWILSGGVVLGGCAWVISHLQTRRLEARNRMLARLVDEQTEEIRTQKHSLEEAVESLEVAYEVVQVINDDLIRTNHELEDRTDQLRETLEANKEILGITAHDLKNPLGGIIGLAEMVVEDLRQGPQATFQSAADNVPLLKSEAERMLSIITDLLDKHRQGEKQVLKREKTVLGDIVSAVVRWNKKRAEAKEIQLLYHTDELLLVHIDVMAIQRVLDNYVSNAIKYSPGQSNVWITVKRLEDLGDTDTIRVSVRDEGPGLTKQDKEKVFGKMQRLSAKPTGGEHSSGLGLYIVKQLVEAHGGQVGVDSVHGEGATFWFTLPVFEPVNEALAQAD